MKISKFEKRYVNSKKQAEKNLVIVRRLFGQIDLKNKKNLLEVGCGIGIATSYLARRYKLNVIGIDLDPEQVEIAKNNHKENEYLKYFQADVTELTFENNQFDMILSLDVLHHIPNWEKALNEISRVLKPDGFYIINDLAVPNFLTSTIRYILKNHMGIFTIDDIVKFLNRNNFQSIYEERPKINILLNHFSIIFQST